MAIITETIANLVGGVSQQVAAQRQPSQAEEQINGYSTIADGVRKRPPIKNVVLLTNTGNNTIGDMFTHKIVRDSQEQYRLTLNLAPSETKMKVFDKDGNTMPLTIEDTPSWFSQDGYGQMTPATAIRAVTLRDTTLLFNTRQEVGYDALQTDPRDTKSLVFVKGVNYGVKYTVRVKWPAGEAEATFTTREADTGMSVRTDEVAGELVGQLRITLPEDFTIFRKDNVIVIEQSFSDPIELEAIDSMDDGYIDAITSSVRSFNSLPTIAPNNFSVQVKGESPDAKPYYLKFQTNNGSDEPSEGYWIETVAPRINYKLHAESMPYELVREADGTFLLRKMVWGERMAGDLETAPWPSFVGKTIQDVYLDRNRLCIVHSDGVCMSRARALFEFFPTTVTTILADGPIDVVPSGAGVANLRSAVAFRERVVLFGDQRQYAIDEPVLSATQPPAILPVTEFSTDEGSLPVAVGRNIYFTTTVGQRTALMEFYAMSNDAQTLDVEDVTRHVPSYIPSGVTKVAASSTANALFLLSKERKNSLWVYKYHWRQTEKLQSCWSRFDFADDIEIVDATFRADVADFLFRIDDNYYIGEMDLREEPEKSDLGYPCLLDLLVPETSCAVAFDPNTNATTITLPYWTSHLSDLQVILVEGEGYTPGSVMQIVSTNKKGRTVEVRGDLSDARFLCGLKYNFSYTFSKQVLRRQSSTGGIAAVAGGRLSLLKWYLRYNETGYFKVRVNVGRDADRFYVYSGRTIGSGIPPVGEIELDDGVFGFRVNGKAEDTVVEVTSDSFVPVALTSAEWEARYSRRTTR